MKNALSFALLSALLSPLPAAAQDPSKGSSALASAADGYWDWMSSVNPVNFSTGTGLHTHDDQLADFSKGARASRRKKLADWQKRFAALDPTNLSPLERTDLEVLQMSVRAEIFSLEEWPQWQVSPALYIDEGVGGVYGLIKRDFAPLDARLKLVVAREKQIPRLIAQARENLKDPPHISVELALEELPGDVEFLEKDAVDAFKDVKDAKLQAQLKASTLAATKAINDYGAWLKSTVLPKAPEAFAIGEKRFTDKLAAEEGIDEPLEQIIAHGEAELKRLQQVFKETAAKIDPAHTPQEVQDALSLDHPPPEQILSDVNSKLAGLKAFLIANKIVSIPSEVMPIVQESPPFSRAFVLASMDTPGPYEKATQAFFNVTLPDPKWSKEQTDSYLRGALSENVIRTFAIHEAFPGHYVQFLWMPAMKSKTRKLYGCSSNIEGWAHYGEQMMLDEGYGDGDPKLRLSQTQEALLRAARYLVGIRMHTRGMTLAEGKAFFIKEGYQSDKVADMESKRGTQDPTYLYYMYGKLQIFKLRDDYKKQLGANYTLLKFHDAFLAQGAVPVPLVRRALLTPATP